jgi:hypothetical protein
LERRGAKAKMSRQRVKTCSRLFLGPLMVPMLLSFFAKVGPVFSSDDWDAVNRLGEEFQRQAPWFRTPGKSGEIDQGIPQPPPYGSVGSREEPQEQTGSNPSYICYEPVARTYYYCLTGWPVSYAPAQYPYFPFWWKYPWSCPPGSRWKSGVGCHWD